MEYAHYLKIIYYANRQSPAPIIWHFANNNNEKNKSCRISFEINKLKQITSIDGNVLFIHVHRETCSSSYFAKSSEMSKNCSQFPLAAKLIYKYLFEVEFDLQNNKHGDFIIDNLPLCINSCFISRWIRIFMGYSSELQLNTDIWNFCKKIVSGRSYK